MPRSAVWGVAAPFVSAVAGAETSEIPVAMRSRTGTVLVRRLMFIFVSFREVAGGSSIPYL